MKSKSISFLGRCSAVVTAFLLALTPGLASADSLPLMRYAATSPVIITEVSTGTKISGTQEFIELYNTTDQPIDLTGWQLWYLSAQAGDVNKPSSSGIILLGEGANSPVIEAHSYYLLSGRNDYLQTGAQQFYGATLAATGGNLRLLSPDDNSVCQLTVQDQMGWGNALYAQGQPVAAPPTGQSVARILYSDGTYQDTHNTAADFTVNGVPSPGATNTPAAMPAAVTFHESALTPIAITGCTVPSPSGSGGLRQPSDNDAPPVQAEPNTSAADNPKNIQTPVLPPSDVGLVTPQITELLPNPAPPQTDASDEFIELYNSNDTAFDLRGFALQVGLTTKHNYVFPEGTMLPPKSFTSFFSSATGLSLSNTEGQVALLDPFGAVINQTEPYAAAKDGQVWALANGKWTWSATPTPGAANIIHAIDAPLTDKKSATTNTAAKKAAATKAATSKLKAAVSKSKTAKAKPKTTTSAATATPGSKTGSALRPGILAAVLVFALLYGLYEYRQDVANKFYQLRANRTARRAARAEPEGG